MLRAATATFSCRFRGGGGLVVVKLAHIILFAGQDGKRLAHLGFLGAFGEENLGQKSLLLALEFHLGLVRLNFDQHVARRHLIANLFLPRANVALRHGGGERRHVDHEVFGII